jgi:hypothetical protein
MPSRFSGSNDASIPGWHMSYHLLGQSSSTVGLYINICCFKESTSQGLIWRMGFFSIAENLCVYSCHHVICWSCCHGWFDQILIWYWLVFYVSQAEENRMIILSDAYHSGICHLILRSHAHPLTLLYVGPLQSLEVNLWYKTYISLYWTLHVAEFSFWPDWVAAYILWF